METLSLAEYIARRKRDDLTEELQSLDEQRTPRWLEWTRANQDSKELTRYNGATVPAGSDGAA